MTYCFFNKNNTIDTHAMHDQISLINKLGSNGIACLGLATEVNKLHFAEKKMFHMYTRRKHKRLNIMIIIGIHDEVNAAELL